MSGIGDQTRWRGVQPTDPAVDIPVTLDGEEISISAPSGASYILDFARYQGSAKVIHTVTAGKVLYITGWWFSCHNFGFETAIVQLYTRDVGDVTSERLFYRYMQPGHTINITGQIVPPHPIPAGYDIVLNSGVDEVDLSGGFSGYEV